ncbi:MAG: threonine aldolase, partial [Bdellovibrionales bacterium]|nr:threonine aldolase [Bdellovibrionales bacterium]
AHYLKTDFLTITESLGADAVSFGGTKNGLLFGEIVLLYNEQAKRKFKYIRKQNMQLPSKMRFLSAQFEIFLKEPGLWREVAAHGHDVALYLANGLRDVPEIQVTQKVEANSVFAKIPKEWVKPLRDKFFFYIWDEIEFEARLMISFDLTKKHVDQFLSLIHKIRKDNNN